MMSEFLSGIIDVFADGPLRGNPLAVVEGGELLDDEMLRRIAREFNQAETTFIMPSTRADRKLRSFTASGAEVFGAGHNALGAWLWLAYSNQLGNLDAPTTFRQEIGNAVLPFSRSKTVACREKCCSRRSNCSLARPPWLRSLLPWVWI